jgi:hypothetical protein
VPSAVNYFTPSAERRGRSSATTAARSTGSPAGPEWALGHRAVRRRNANSPPSAIECKSGESPDVPLEHVDKREGLYGLPVQPRRIAVSLVPHPAAACDPLLYVRRVGWRAARCVASRWFTPRGLTAT